MTKQGAPKRNEFPDSSFAFRLNKGKPNEDRALDVIARYTQRGYNPRQIVVMALLALDGKQIVAGGGDQLSQLVDQFGGTLDELRGVIELLRETGLTPTARKQIKPKTVTNAPPGYLANLRSRLHSGEENE